MKPLFEYPKEQREDPAFKEKYREMLERVRCVWCAAELYIGDLDMNEHDEPAYCPICGHDEFDNRSCKSLVSAMFLQNTWKQKGKTNE